eukprot:CAMPEP_0182857704 /NCGR_PEP_ID=MMETSP0034_2-20130328/3207_1 /TAXON_ID=156128 /ORGANISM="Nephroselmis pyriformis, Strain CCMP717" /LENGTH=126 /DNA_ID=CAMNT_0024988969 /DNA_START=284 /DNA_END=664 /DNA_ORIENTATION=+
MTSCSSLRAGCLAATLRSTGGATLLLPVGSSALTALSTGLPASLSSSRLDILTFTSWLIVRTLCRRRRGVYVQCSEPRSGGKSGGGSRRERILFCEPSVLPEPLRFTGTPPPPFKACAFHLTGPGT